MSSVDWLYLEVCNRVVRKVEVFVYEGGFLVIYTGPVVIYSDV